MPQRPPATLSDLERDAAFGVLYPKLRRMAHRQLRRNEPITLLDTTGLVHEFWLRFAGNAGRPVDDEGFLGYATREMRFVVIDFVRRRQTQRRGGDLLHVTLDTATAESATLHDEQLQRLQDALEELAPVDGRPLQCANQALDDLRAGRLQRVAVLVPDTGDTPVAQDRLGRRR